MRSHRYPRPHPAPRSAFAGYRFPPEVITLAVRWYLRFGLSYQDWGRQIRVEPHCDGRMSPSPVKGEVDPLTS